LVGLFAKRDAPLQIRHKPLPAPDKATSAAVHPSRPGFRLSQRQSSLKAWEYLQSSAKRLGKCQDWIVQAFEKECGPGSFQRLANFRQAM